MNKVANWIDKVFKNYQARSKKDDPIKENVWIDNEHDLTCRKIQTPASFKSKVHFAEEDDAIRIKDITKISDDEKSDELLTVILEKFKDYKTNCEVENDLIGKLITELQRSRSEKRDELDAEENALCNGMNELDAIMKAHTTHVMY